MLGIVLISHGGLAESFSDVVRYILGRQEQLAALGIHADDDPEKHREDIMQAVESVDSGSGVVIVADMFGGIPANLAASIQTASRTEIITGMSLPLLLKLISVRDVLSLPLAVEQAILYGRKYIETADTLTEKLA